MHKWTCNSLVVPVCCNTGFAVWLPSVHSSLRVIVLQALLAGTVSLFVKHVYSRRVASMSGSSGLPP